MSFQKIERIDEVWKPVEGFAHYLVSNKGQIKRKERRIENNKTGRKITLKEKVMKQRWNKNCKCFFLDLLNDEGKRKTVYPHKEVAKAFCINVLPEKFTMIVHLDNNPKNNSSENLEWVTPSDHMAFQFQVGNKDNYKVWKTRKRKYPNGFKKTKQSKPEKQFEQLVEQRA